MNLPDNTPVWVSHLRTWARTSSNPRPPGEVCVYVGYTPLTVREEDVVTVDMLVQKNKDSEEFKARVRKGELLIARGRWENDC